MRRLVLLAAFLASVSARGAGASALSIYFIDVEGGQSTLVVTPSGESLLIDAGFAADGRFSSAAGDPASARDAQRIVAAMRDAGVKQIDNLMVTHFHADHDGGIPELGKLVAIRRFIDHGRPADNAEQGVAGTQAAFDAYTRARGSAPHIEPHPGDQLPLTGVDATVVSSAANTITNPLVGGGGVNNACGSPPLPAQEKTENPRSTGVLLQYGRFRFLDIGDLSGPPLYALFCPRDLVGPVDVYLLPHHGGVEAGDPAVFGATPPRAAIVNNGAVKGGAPEMFAAAHAVPRMDVWQIHRSRNASARNYPDARIANLDETSAHWITVIAQSDGSFVVTNPRTNERRHYPRTH